MVKEVQALLPTFERLPTVPPRDELSFSLNAQWRFQERAILRCGSLEDSIIVSFDIIWALHS